MRPAVQRTLDAFSDNGLEICEIGEGTRVEVNLLLASNNQPYALRSRLKLEEGRLGAGRQFELANRLSESTLMTSPRRDVTPERSSTSLPPAQLCDNRLKSKKSHPDNICPSSLF